MFNYRILQIKQEFNVKKKDKEKQLENFIEQSKNDYSRL